MSVVDGDCRRRLVADWPLAIGIHADQRSAESTVSLVPGVSTSDHELIFSATVG